MPPLKNSNDIQDPSLIWWTKYRPLKGKKNCLELSIDLFVHFSMKCSFLQTLLVEQGLTVCLFCVCEFVSLCEIISRPLIGGKLATSYDVARLLLMVPIEPWRNSTPFFGATCPCRSHIQRLHYPAFAAFLFSGLVERGGRVKKIKDFFNILWHFFKAPLIRVV